MHQLLRHVVQCPLRRSRGQILAKAQQPGQHALHIGIKNRHPLAKAEGSDRCCGRRPDARQRHQGSAAARKCAPVQIPHLLRAGMQIACAAVVAQAAPQGHHFFLRRIGQGAHIRKCLQKTRVVIQHREHLGLLQHHFRQPDAVRIPLLLPGQAMATMLALPCHQPRKEGSTDLLQALLAGQQAGIAGRQREQGGAIHVFGKRERGIFWHLAQT